MIEKPKSLGSEAPQVLFVLGRAKSSEIQSNQCLNSSTGSYLIKLLNSVDLVGVSRFTNLIISSVSLMNTEYTWEHIDFIEEQTRWTELVKDEIIKYNPKLVVGLGQLVSDTLGVISSHNGVLTQVNINDKIYNYLPMYSPTWIMNNESNTVDQYLKELDSIRLYLGLESKLQSFNNLQKLDKCELMSAKTYDEFYDIYTRYLKSHELLAYDIETNAMPIYTKGSKIVGFSLACKENTVQWDKYEDTSKVGVYVVVESSDYIMSDDDKFKTFNLLKQILSSHRIVVHNSAYERPYTHHCLNYYLTYKQTEDTLVLARLMNGGKGKAGLKLQAQQFLGYPDWETDSYDFLSAFHNLTDIVTSSSKKKYKVYDSNGVEVSYMNSDIPFVEYYELAKENYNYKGKKSKNFDNLHPVTYEVTRLVQILTKYYEEDEIPEVLNKLGDYIKKYPDPKSKSYECLPSRIVCKYGALDSIATIDLYNYYQARLTDETTDEVDLHEGYRNWKEHMYAGTVLECNGFHWNDEVATQDYREFGEIKLRCLKYLVRSELSKDFIIDQCYNMYVARAISEIYTHEAGLLGIVIKDYDRKTNKYKLWLNDKRAAVGKLQDAVSKAPALVEQIKQSCYQYFMQELDDIQNESEIIKFYNPKSSTHSILPKTIFKNDDLLRFGHWMTRSLTLYTSPTMEDFRKLIQSGSHANAYEVKFFNLLELITDPLKLKELDIDINQVFEMMSELSSHIDNPEFRMQDEDYNIIIDTMSEPMIIDIASWYFHVGIDVEDDSTWTPEFRWLYTFREYKKVDKLVTSYIEGSVGRGSVYIVDKKVEESGAKDVPRLRPYDGKFDKETEDCILAASWGVNVVETGRWKCFHGDTKIKSLDGNSYSFKELVDKGIHELWIYSRDETNKIIPALATNPRKTKEVTQLVKITLDNGEEIQCTPDHRFRLVDGSYKEAQYITSSDNLSALYLSENSNGYILYYNEESSSYEQVYQLVNRTINYENYERVHNKVASMSDVDRWDATIVTHHIDLNKRNNVPSNLQWMTWRDHVLLHGTRHNPLRKWNKTPEAQAMRIEVRNRPENIVQARNHITQYNKSEVGKENSRQRALSDTGVNSPENRRKASIRMTKMNRSAESRDRSRIQGAKLSSYKTEEHKRQDAERCRLRNKDSEFQLKAAKSKFLKLMRSMYEEGIEITEESYEALRTGNRVHYAKLLDKYYEGDYSKLMNDVLHYNHKIVNLEIINLDIPVAVYDITVDKYHNFALDCGIFVHNSGAHTIPWGSPSKCYYDSRFEGGTIVAPDYSQAEVRTMAMSANETAMLQAYEDGADIHAFTASRIWNKPIDQVEPAERRFAKMSTFSILYGSSEFSFARNFCDGDMEKAHEIMNGFYEAYPNIKKWTSERHREMETTGKVSLISNRFIKISPKSQDRMDIEAAYRKAGNYPIQGCSSDIVGCVLFELCKYLDDNNYKSKPFMFVHDSIEVDIHPYELIDLLVVFPGLLHSIPRERFGIPAKADFTLGKSLGHEIDLDGLDKVSEDKSRAIIKLSGYQDEIIDTLNVWKKAYKTVKVLEEEYKEEYVPLSEMFIPKKSYTKWLGKTRMKGSAKVLINYYESEN